MFSLKKITGALLCGMTALSFAVPVIVIPQKASVQEKKAAEELAMHLKLATGKAVKTVTENNAVSGKKIYLGNTLFAQKNKVSFAGMDKEEHLVKALSADTLIIGGGFPRGTLYGVYGLLEEVFGLKIYAEEVFDFTNTSVTSIGTLNT